MPLDTLLDVPAWCNVGQGSFSFGDKGEVVCSPFFFSGTQVGSRVCAVLARRDVAAFRALLASGAKATGSVGGRARPQYCGKHADAAAGRRCGRLRSACRRLRCVSSVACCCVVCRVFRLWRATAGSSCWRSVHSRPAARSPSCCRMPRSLPPCHLCFGYSLPFCNAAVLSGVLSTLRYTTAQHSTVKYSSPSAYYSSTRRLSHAQPRATCCRPRTASCGNNPNPRRVDTVQGSTKGTHTRTFAHSGAADGGAAAASQAHQDRDGYRQGRVCCCASVACFPEGSKPPSAPSAPAAPRSPLLTS